MVWAYLLTYPYEVTRSCRDILWLSWQVYLQLRSFCLYKLYYAILEGHIVFAFLEVNAPPATASCVRCGNGRNALNPIKTEFCHVIENKKYPHPVLTGLSCSAFTFYLLECHDVSISSSYHYVRMYCNC